MPDGELEHAAWVQAGYRLGAIGRCSQWWVGDWIRYGSSRWGERYAEAARVTGYDPGSLRNMAWVAAHVDLSLRSDKLTWSHHALIAPLEPDEQRYWLERAVRDGLSVADLRIELRSAARGRKRRRVDDGAQIEPAAADTIVCPNCGHHVPAALS